MFEKELNTITEDDLKRLIENAIPEDKTTEYKETLPDNSKNGKEEFAADVSSFANASGGDLVFGIVEDREKGLPTSLEGLESNNIDQEILRLDSIMRDGIEPRIPNTLVKSVSLSNNKQALVIRVPKSWLAPHRVKYNDKFYSRTSNGKYPLDVSELRSAFYLSETTTERIRKFIIERASIIMANEMPILLQETAKIALHLIPIGAFSPGQKYDLSTIAANPGQMPPIHSSGWNNRYNLDGLLTYSSYQDRKPYSYVQVFRNSILEAVDTSILEPDGDHGLNIPSILFQREILQSARTYLSLLKSLNVELPIMVFMELFGVKGYKMGVDTFYRLGQTYSIDRDMLSLPEIVIDKYDVPFKDIMKPMFDALWNACGFPKSMNYDKA